jgi:hypothetical protein
MTRNRVICNVKLGNYDVTNRNKNLQMSKCAVVAQLGCGVAQKGAAWLSKGVAWLR